MQGREQYRQSQPASPLDTGQFLYRLASQMRIAKSDELLRELAEERINELFIDHPNEVDAVFERMTENLES